LQQGPKTIDKYDEKEFLELIKYIHTYNQDDKLKMNRFISGLNLAYRNQLSIPDLKTLVNAIKKVRHCEERTQGQQDLHKKLKEKGNKQHKFYKPSSFQCGKDMQHSHDKPSTFDAYRKRFKNVVCFKCKEKKSYT
jgi:hypothetical protein